MVGAVFFSSNESWTLTKLPTRFERSLRWIKEVTIGAAPPVASFLDTENHLKVRINDDVRLIHVPFREKMSE